MSADWAQIERRLSADQQKCRFSCSKISSAIRSTKCIYLQTNRTLITFTWFRQNAFILDVVVEPTAKLECAQFGWRILSKRQFKSPDRAAETKVTENIQVFSIQLIKRRVFDSFAAVVYTLVSKLPRNWHSNWMLFLSPDRTAYTKTVWNTQASYTHKKALFLDPFAVAYGDFGVDRTAEMDSISAVSMLILYANQFLPRNRLRSIWTTYFLKTNRKIVQIVPRKQK